MTLVSATFLISASSACAGSQMMIRWRPSPSTILDRGRVATASSVVTARGLYPWRAHARESFWYQAENDDMRNCRAFCGRVLGLLTRYARGGSWPNSHATKRDGRTENGFARGEVAIGDEAVGHSPSRTRKSSQRNGMELPILDKRSVGAIVLTHFLRKEQKYS